MKIGDIVKIYRINRYTLQELIQFHKIESIIGDVCKTKRYIEHSKNEDKFNARDVIHKTHAVLILSEDQIKCLLQGDNNVNDK